MGLRSILEVHPQGMELLCIRIPALGCLGRGFHGRLNGLGPFFGNHLYQSGFVGGIGLGPSESGEEIGMGKGWIHGDLIF